MSDTDSFIDEVTEEVRRDKLFVTLKKYGWIGVAAVVLIVGGAAWREYSIASERAASQAFGDAILSALEEPEASDRISALQAIDAPVSGGQAILQMLVAAEQSNNDLGAEATETLRGVAVEQDVPAIYRQIANYKALARGSDSLSPQERRLELDVLATPGSPLRLLAEEQIAILEVEQGDVDAAISRLKNILADSEVTAGLRRRASQLIVALGGSLDQA